VLARPPTVVHKPAELLLQRLHLVGILEIHGRLPLPIGSAASLSRNAPPTKRWLATAARRQRQASCFQCCLD
jgi:hypothetical protein